MKTHHVSGRGGTLVGMAVCAVVLGDWLFYRQPLGWTVALFTALLAAALTWRAGAARGRPSGLVTLGALGVVVVAMVEHPGWLEIVLAALGLTLLAMNWRGGWTTSVPEWGERLVVALTGAAWAKPLNDLVTARRWRRRHPQPGGRPAFVRGWGLPVALGLVFVGLFVLANPVFERWADDALGKLGDYAEYFRPGRLVFWAALALGFLALLRLRGRRARRPSRAESRRGNMVERMFSDAVLLRCLIVFNIVFAVQTVLDIVFLWSGSELPAGISYPEYAHRGAYPLLAATLLAGVFVLLAYRPSDRHSAGRVARAARWLVCLWLAQNVWLMVSSVRRLDLYVDVYSLTRLRVAAAIWMAVVALLLVALILRIVLQRDNRWLLQIGVLLGLSVCLVASLVNFDGIIAWYNVRHCRLIAGVGSAEAPRTQLDVDYLAGLGVEAMPALRWYADRLASEPEAARGSEAMAATRAADELEVRLDRMMRDWRGWTWRRQRLVEAAMVTTSGDRSPGGEARR